MPGKSRKQAKEGPERSWNLQEIQELIDLLVNREIREFEMEKGGVKIRIKRGNAPAETLGPESALNLPLESSPQGFEPASPAEPLASAPRAEEARAPEPTEGLHIIKSPIVGTFYASPAPNAPPFVKVGDTVDVGQVLCIIEAMKLMNEIEAEVGGEIARIYVENGQPVEYGQSLFAIKPSLKR
jgi:acetyl-CoA carboxylase biotin carboxyl carrier protein